MKKIRSIAISLLLTCALLGTVLPVMPDDGVSATLPTDGVSATLPTDGVSATLPADGVSATLPADGVSAILPNGGTSATLPTDGVSATLPNDSTSATLPAGNIPATLSAKEQGAEENYTARLVITAPSKWRPTYGRVLADIRTLKKQYPGLVDYSYFGKSAAGIDIPVVTLGKGPKEILIVAAMHPAEHVTSLQVMRSIDTYAYAYAKKQKIDGISVRDVLNRVTFYFAPIPNPDGVAIVMGKANAKQKALAVKVVGERFYRNNRALHWKGNANAVNLNRNFPAKWEDQEKAYRKPTSVHYPGKSAASEPETRALMELCLAHDFAFALSDHTYGQVLYWNDPYTGTIPGAASLLNKLKKATGYKPDTTLPHYNGGRFEKWFRYTFNRPAVVVEMLPSGYGIPRSYANFDRMLWKRTRSLFLQVADCGGVTDSYKLYFDANQGKVKTAWKNITLAHSVGKLPRPTRAGYSFAGWYTKKSGGMEVTAETQLTENRSLQLYAHWEEV